MRIINIVDNVSKVNFGIWNAAVSTAAALHQQHGVTTELWAPAGEQPVSGQAFEFVPLSDLTTQGCSRMIEQRGLSPLTDIIVTHGTWRFCTAWGHMLAQQGYAWVAVPHGMLRWWCLKIKPWKKYPFFYLSERPKINAAAAIRAVSRPELDELKTQFSRPERIFYQPNCVTLPDPTPQPRSNIRKVLFMARIHYGKRVVELAQAWIASELYNHPQFSLDIAGPDHGALADLQAVLDAHPQSNIRYVGPQYGTAKDQLLRSASAYVLPSMAESFPSSVVEALSYGLVTLMTPHCNFPEAFENQIAFDITDTVDGIRTGLNQLAHLSDLEWQSRSEKGMALIASSYTDTQTAAAQVQQFKHLLAQRSV
jgi:poly(glycerol-phosphate) alpha-glucosyltransferase